MASDVGDGVCRSVLIQFTHSRKTELKRPLVGANVFALCISLDVCKPVTTTVPQRPSLGIERNYTNGSYHSLQYSHICFPSPCVTESSTYRTLGISCSNRARQWVPVVQCGAHLLRALVSLHQRASNAFGAHNLYTWRHYGLVVVITTGPITCKPTLYIVGRKLIPYMKQLQIIIIKKWLRSLVFYDGFKENYNSAPKL